MLDKQGRTPELRGKIFRNLLLLFIFTSIMIFAGFTSAYLVMQGDRFWVNVAMPTGFQISTALIFVGSGLLILSRFFLKKDNQKAFKLSLTLALITSIAFGFTQLKGFTQLFESGNAVRGDIMTVDGRYGKYFSLMYEGKNVTFDGAEFVFKGETISSEMHDEIRVLGAEIMQGTKTKEKEFDLTDYGTKWILLFNEAPLTYNNKHLQSNGADLEISQYVSLQRFGENLKNDRGDFIMQGTYGEDFWVYYNGNKLDYVNRQLMLDGQPLSDKLRVDLFSQQNTASSFIWVFTFMHLLHWILGIIFLIIVFFRALKVGYSKTHHNGLSLASTFWHFLGILWLYLYLFLIYIH